MTQLGGKTSYTAAYSSAMSAFARTRGFHQRIIMITDGKPSEPIQIVRGWVKLILQKVLTTIGLKSLTHTK
jgi:hypothetical protein